MPRLSHLAGLAVAALLATGATATSASAQTPATITPLQAYNADMSGVSVVTYYTEEADGYHLVVTASDANGAMPIRFTTTLLPGQTSGVAVSQGADRAPAAIEITHSGDRMVVETRGTKVAQHLKD